MEPKRMGRPPKSKDGNLAKFLRVRVTEGDYAELEKAASIAGLGLSDWIRDRLQAVARREIRKSGAD